MEIQTVTFFGSHASQPSEDNYKQAEIVAKAIAESGRMVINGGGPGVMLAATKGAKKGHGQTEVVYYRPELADHFAGEVAANHADKSYEESNYIERTERLLELGDAYIVFNGGTGTLSEFAMAWGVARLYIDHHKPLLLYGEFWHELMAAFKKYMNISPDEERVYTIVTTPQDVIKALSDFEEILIKANHKHAACKGPECTLFLQ